MTRLLEFPELCACGQPLHYADPAFRELTETLVEALGPTMAVTTPSGRYEVSRHYIALHGIKAQELDALAEQGIVTRVARFTISA